MKKAELTSTPNTFLLGSGSGNSADSDIETEVANIKVENLPVEKRLNF